MTGFSGLQVPGPTVTALTASFWAAAQEGRLLIQHCEACDRSIFYPRQICPHCWSNRLEWRDTSGRGQLRTFSRVHRPGHPAWVEVAPYVIGLVELAEGPTMLSVIIEGNAEAYVGAPLTIAPTMLGERRMPFFAVETIRNGVEDTE
jgi:uncharacterized OB-fold protein